MDTIDGHAAFTINETAKRANIGRSTVYRLIADNTLETVKVYGRTLITARSIRRLLGLDRPFGADDPPVVDDTPRRGRPPRHRSRTTVKIPAAAA